MHKLLLILCFTSLGLLSSCGKFIEKKKKDAIVEAMTDGRWYVILYKEVNTDVTSEFSGYEFQFFDNGTVKGYLNTSVTDGTWVGDVNALTISATFPSATLPVSRLTGLWKVTENSWTDVTAYKLIASDTNWLKLRKK